ncbi:MAG: hypothetical protein J6K58_06220 [Lachnospiraceae bacterium]|nr:hypothetical protein [Lachnospiraceae bacterium]
MKKSTFHKKIFSVKRRKLPRIFTRRNIKDAVFCRIFSSPEVLLELYNALNHTHYTNISDLEIYTMDDVIYMGYKNDVSFIIGSMLNLYEHQSSVNPNMPVRGLIYFAKRYESYIETHKLNIYGTKRILLPMPQYVVFYNGTENLENNAEYMEYRLTDSFINTNIFENKDEHTAKDRTVKHESSLECVTKVYNINFGSNAELMQECRTLYEYSYFMNQIMKNCSKEISLEKCIDMAVQHCINQGILRDFLLKNRAEMVGMLLEEFDVNKFLEMDRRDQREIGYESGVLQGADDAFSCIERLRKGETEEQLLQQGYSQATIKRAKEFV